MNVLSDFLIPKDHHPDWLVYPAELKELILAGRHDLTPWHLLTADSAESGSRHLKLRYERDLIPFARRKTNDDFACFERDCGSRVLVINSYTDKGYEDVGRYENFDEWFREVELDMEGWIE